MFLFAKPPVPRTLECTSSAMRWSEDHHVLLEALGRVSKATDVAEPVRATPLPGIITFVGAPGSSR